MGNPAGSGKLPAEFVIQRVPTVTPPADLPVASQSCMAAFVPGSSCDTSRWIVCSRNFDRSFPNHRQNWVIAVTAGLSSTMTTARPIRTSRYLRKSMAAPSNRLGHEGFPLLEAGAHLDQALTDGELVVRPVAKGLPRAAPFDSPRT